MSITCLEGDLVMLKYACSCSRRIATQWLLIASFAFAGCTTVQPETSTIIDEPIRLGISAIDIINEDTIPEVESHIDHIQTPSPAMRLADWANDTLIPVDSRGNLLVTVAKAILTEEQLDEDGSFKELFINEQSRLVRVDIQAYFSFGHPENSRSATITIKAEYEMTIAENTSPDQVDKIRLAVIDEGIAQLDAEFRRQLDSLTSDGAWPKA
jgi:hypothetical protein